MPKTCVPTYILEAYTTVAIMFTVIELNENFSHIMMDMIEYHTFRSIYRYFGDARKREVYLAHIPWQLFLAKYLDWSIVGCPSTDTFDVIIFNDIWFFHRKR